MRGVWNMRLPRSKIWRLRGLFRCEEATFRWIWPGRLLKRTELIYRLPGRKIYTTGIAAAKLATSFLSPPRSPAFANSTKSRVVSVRKDVRRMKAQLVSSVVFTLIYGSLDGVSIFEWRVKHEHKPFEWPLVHRCRPCLNFRYGFVLVVPKRRVRNRTENPRKSPCISTAARGSMMKHYSRIGLEKDIFMWVCTQRPV